MGESSCADELALQETTIEYVDSTKSQKKYIVYIQNHFLIQNLKLWLLKMTIVVHL